MARRHELEKQVAELQARVEAFDTQLDAYRSKENAIVEALTQAQDAAARRIADATLQAEKKLIDAQKQSEAILQEARAKAELEHSRAATIVESAQQEAKRRLQKAEEAKHALEEKLGNLNAALFETARQAADEAERFSHFMDSLQLSKHSLNEQPAQYDTPRDLMHGIYQLQGRDAPYEDDYNHDADDLPSPEHIEHQNHITEHSYEADAEADVKEPEENALSEQAPSSDERLWTVDEIMESIEAEPIEKEEAASKEDEEIDLDSLLDEILGE